MKDSRREYAIPKKRSGERLSVRSLGSVSGSGSFLGGGLLGGGLGFRSSSSLGLRGSSSSSVSSGRDGRSGRAGPRSRRVLTSRSRVDSLVPSRGSSVLELVFSHSLSGKSSIALVKRARVVVTGDVPVAAHYVVDVVAPLPGVRSVVTSTNAELVVRDELSPLFELESLSTDVGEKKTSDRVTVSISSVRVELSSIVASRDVHLGEFTGTSNLNVLLSPGEVNSGEGSFGNQTSSVSSFGAPSDFVTFGISDSSLGRRTPETEVVYTVDPSGLAVGVGRVSVLAAVVVSVLTVLRLVRRVLGIRNDCTSED